VQFNYFVFPVARSPTKKSVFKIKYNEFFTKRLSFPRLIGNYDSRFGDLFIMKKIFFARMLTGFDVSVIH
jgi:hypothetical protein